MKHIILLVFVGFFLVTGTPVIAGGIFDDSGDVWHFIAGMIVEEKREDIRHEQKMKEKQEYEAKQKQHIEEHKQDQERERKVSRAKMRMLFQVHRDIVNEVLEESSEATDFVLDIHEGNDYKVKRTAIDIAPFVEEYFDVFNYNDRSKMYSLWVEVKFTNWIESYYE